MKPIIKAYMTVYGASEDDAWTAYESMSPDQYHEIMRMYNSGYTATQPTETENAPQAATQAAKGTDEKKEAETMTTTEREALERINARQNAANHFTNIGPADIAAELAAMEAEQAAPAPDPDAVTDEEEEATPATPGDMLKVRNIIMSKGGYRERHLLTNPHTATRSTWTTDHKVIEILEATPGPDGYRAGCAVDIVTRSIVG